LCQFDEILLTSAVDCDSVAVKVLTFYRWIRETESDVPSANVDHPAYYFANNVKQPIALLADKVFTFYYSHFRSAKIDCKIIRGYGKEASFARQLGEGAWGYFIS